MLTREDLKINILKIFAAGPGFGCNKFNVIGRGYGRTELEASLNITFDKEQRATAARAFDELKGAGLIRPTYSDGNDPENWCEITDAGRAALAHGTLDELDDALRAINPHLVEIRRGAWAALAAGQPDSLRQAAHSGRELIDQVLRESAPDSAIEAEPGFRPDPDSNSGVTRKMRLRFLMRQLKGSASEADLAIADKACDLVLAVDKKLTAQSHSRTPPSASDVEDALNAAEIALRRVLL